MAALLDTDAATAPVYGHDQDRLAEGWARIIAEWETFLGEYRRAASDADLTATASAACDEVATNPDSDLLPAIVGDVDRWNRPHSLAGLVIEAWKVVRGRGDTPGGCLSFALAAEGRHPAGRVFRGGGTAEPNASLPGHTAGSARTTPPRTPSRLPRGRPLTGTVQPGPSTRPTDSHTTSRNSPDRWGPPTVPNRG